jgi:CRP/FNR family nitrogen fixation transcriptional regulator
MLSNTDVQHVEHNSLLPRFDQSSERGSAKKSNKLLRAIEDNAVRKSFSRNAEIYGENEPCDYMFKVVSGAVRSYKLVLDGRRLVGAFYLPGEFFGIEASERHLFSSEAVVNAELLVVRREVILSLAARDPEIAHDLWSLTARELLRAQSHMLLLNKSASERVASFLLEMSERRQSHEEVQLPMSRQDVADYLGLTSETVSRMLTRFEDASAIVLPSCRRVVVRNRSALRRMVS